MRMAGQSQIERARCAWDQIEEVRTVRQKETRGCARTGRQGGVDPWRTPRGVIGRDDTHGGVECERFVAEQLHARRGVHSSKLLLGHVSPMFPVPERSENLSVGSQQGLAELREHGEARFRIHDVAGEDDELDLPAMNFSSDGLLDCAYALEMRIRDLRDPESV
jgi:hypothetical protein